MRSFLIRAWDASEWLLGHLSFLIRGRAPWWNELPGTIDMDHVVGACGKWGESVSGACGKCVGSDQEMCGKCVGSAWGMCRKCAGSVGGSCFGSGWDCGIEREHM